MARYNLSFCYYMNKQYYEAAVLAEHYARRYPQGGLAAKSTEIGMQAWADAYSTYTDFDRRSDLNHLIDLAKYTAETWPDKEQGDGARINLGQIYLGMGQYDKAIEILGSVRQRSRDWASAQNRLGSAHWAKSRDLERRGDATAAQAEAQKAIDVLNVALQGPPRRQCRADRSRPGRQRGRPGDRAHRNRQARRGPRSCSIRSSRPRPSSRARATRRLIEAQLKAFITSGNVEPAIASMKALEQSGGASGRAQLYFKLGKLLEKELESLKEKKNTAALDADASGLQDVFDHPGREQDGAIVRVAPVGRRGPA